MKLPRGKVLRLGTRDDQVALLRQRLKVPSENPDSNDLYDDALLDAVKDYQRANGLAADGLVGNGVRNALNGGGKSKRIDPTRNVDRLIANMERWRWLPRELGAKALGEMCRRLERQCKDGQDAGLTDLVAAVESMFDRVAPALRARSSVSCANGSPRYPSKPAEQMTMSGRCERTCSIPAPTASI